MKSKSGVVSVLLTVGLFMVQPAWSACIEGDCVQGEGVYVSEDGKKYRGSFVDGKAQGNGTMIFPDGSSYTGSFYRGKTALPGHDIVPA
jgi:hypothetical protein